MQQQFIDNKFGYFTYGKDPQLLIHSGTHGDEHEVIDLVTGSLRKYESQLPPFIFVPHVSPSAVRAKTRENGKGEDLNRLFLDGSKEQEVLWNQAILQKGPFELAVSFHEDLGYKFYYLYDETRDGKPTKLVVDHNNWLSQNGVQLLDGFDDPDDPALGIHFTNGYRHFTYDPSRRSGMIMNWAMFHGHVEHALVSETPGLVDLATKEKIIDSFFRLVLLKYPYGPQTT